MRRARWSSCAAPTIRQTRGGNTPPDGRKVQATLHWVSAADSVTAEVRLYNPLFAKSDPNAGDFAADLNPNSLEVLPDARLEPALAAGNALDAGAVRASGLLLPRRRLPAGPPRVQPHRGPARHVGQGVGRRQGLTTFCGNSARAASDYAQSAQ